MVQNCPLRKTALVTGAGTGIGRGIALELAREGYDVMVHYCGSVEGARHVCKEVEAMGRIAVPCQADISAVEQIRSLFAVCRREFNHLDVFVNNAGLTMKAPFLETTEEMFDKICGVDFKGAYFCIQEAGRFMAETGTQGSIVLISSNNAMAHFGDVSVYGSVKAAATKLAEHAAIELAKYGIRVNTVAPGWTDTGADRLDAKENTFYKVPLKRWATPGEIGKTVCFLSSAAAASVTGAALVVDGGALLVSDKAEKYGF